MFSWSYLNPTVTVTGTGLSDPAQVQVGLATLIISTGGLALNLQDSAWPQPFLTLWADAAQANLRYHLSTVPPAGAAGLAVTVNGARVLSPKWTYNAAGDAIVFQASSAPNTGDSIQVTYPIGCP
jgi:hypothetical protein